MIPVTRASKNALQHSDPLPRLARGFSLLSAYQKATTKKRGGAKELISLVIGAPINNNVVFLAFFAFAAPLGLNTVVFPAAYGEDSSTGASMAMISHTLCVLTIPLLYALMTLIFGEVVPV